MRGIAQIQVNADVPRILSYQGQLTTTDGQAMNGLHHISATLYSDMHGKNVVWSGEYDAVVTEGIVSIALGSGNFPLPDIAILNQHLWIGIKVDQSAELKPLTQLASAPYALNVADKSITEAKLSDDLVQTPLTTGGTAPKTQGISFDPCSSNNDGGGSPNTNFIGGGCSNATLNNNYNVISGGDTNTVDTGSSYNGIIGGYRNYVHGIYSVLGGGEGNQITGACTDAIGGGSFNINSAQQNAVIAGSSTNTVNGDYSVVGGGSLNYSSSNWSAGGGVPTLVYNPADAPINFVVFGRP